MWTWLGVSYKNRRRVVKWDDYAILFGWKLCTRVFLAGGSTAGVIDSVWTLSMRWNGKGTEPLPRAPSQYIVKHSSRTLQNRSRPVTWFASLVGLHQTNASLAKPSLPWSRGKLHSKSALTEGWPRLARQKPKQSHQIRPSKGQVSHEIERLGAESARFIR